MPRKVYSHLSSNTSSQTSEPQGATTDQSCSVAGSTGVEQLAHRGLLSKMITSGSSLSARLSWKNVVELYKGEWLLISDYGWEPGKAYPRWVCIQSHASDHASLMRQMNLKQEMLRVGVGERTGLTCAKDPLIIFVDEPFSQNDLEPITARV